MNDTDRSPLQVLCPYITENGNKDGNYYDFLLINIEIIKTQSNLETKQFQDTMN